MTICKPVFAVINMEFQQYEIAINAIFELKKMYLQIATGLVTANVVTVAFAINSRRYRLILWSLVYFVFIFHFYGKMNHNLKTISNDVKKIEQNLIVEKVISEPIINNYYQNLDKGGLFVNHFWTSILIGLIVLVEVFIFVKLSNKSPSPG